MRNLRTLSVATLAATAISGGALLTAPSASAADGPSDFYTFKCINDKDASACEAEAKLTQTHMSTDALKCVAGAGISVAGVLVGDGIPATMAASVARKYVASAGAACLSSVIIGKI